MRALLSRVVTCSAAAFLLVASSAFAGLYSRLPFGGSWRDTPMYKVTTAQGVEFVRAPMPKYPPGTDHLMGRAIVQLKLNRATGDVVGVELIQSSGYEALDRAALRTLRHWQARPGVRADVVNIPVKFAGHEAATT